MCKKCKDTPPPQFSILIKATYTATAALSKKVAHESALSTKFSYHVANGKNKKTETATSYLYVTLDTPEAGTELYHTVVHIGCSAALGESESNKVFEKIWSKFSGTDICISKVKIDSGAIADDPAGKLYYYGIDATVPPGYVYNANIVPLGEPANTYTVARKEWTASTQDILQYCDGRCGAWQSFFLDIVRIHKINATAANIYVNTNRAVQILCVKENAGKHHGTNPKERSWGDHAIILLRSNETYYDTSYGQDYGSDKVEAARIFVTGSVNQFYGVHNTSTTPPIRILGWYSSVRPNRVLFEFNDEDDGND
jgi:hypothetical protein